MHSTVLLFLIQRYIIVYREYILEYYFITQRRVVTCSFSYQLMRHCWLLSPEDRPSFGEILTHIETWRESPNVCYRTLCFLGSCDLVFHGHVILCFMVMWSCVSWSCDLVFHGHVILCCMDMWSCVARSCDLVFHGHVILCCMVMWSCVSWHVILCSMDMWLRF